MLEKIVRLTDGQKIWVSGEILDWSAHVDNTQLGISDWKGHYEPWQHANETLKRTQTTEQDLASAIFQLRRAVEFRENALRLFYGLDQIPGTTKNTVLTDLQIVQPIMRHELRRLRNMVAHEYGAALPEVSRCREFAEFTFYFLRSTDRLLDSPVGGLSFDGPENAGSFLMNIKPGTWIMSIEGELDRRLVSELPDHKAMEVTIWRANIYKDKVYFEHNGLGGDASLCTMHGEMKTALIKLYFEKGFS